MKAYVWLLLTVKQQAYAHKFIPTPLVCLDIQLGQRLGCGMLKRESLDPRDHPLYENTVYAIELNAKVYLEEWGKDIRVMLEEPGFYGPDGFRYVNGRQTELLLIGSKTPHLE